jgi:hypothetical protein
VHAPNALALFLSLLCVAITAACADATTCEPEAQRQCIGSNDCDGTQTCASDGSAYGECECEDRIVPSSVGKRCLRDAECAADETCFDGDAESFLGGIPPVAICSLRCDEEPEVCERREPASICVVTDDRGTEDVADDQAHCLEACTIGEVSDEKCRGEEGLVCATVESLAEGAKMRAMRAASTEAGVCRPLCSRDADCSPDVCNPRTGACDSEERQGDAFGAECDPSSEESTCEGICVEVEGASFCSHRCWFGSAENCGGEGADVKAGLCRFPEESRGLIGDAGFCAVLCDTTADCVHPDLECEPFDEEGVSSIVGKAGVCVPNAG